MMQLVYISQATDLFSPGQFPHILEKSRKNNAALGVTGMLAYDAGAFIQVLEGQEGAIRRLYDKILKDPRHQSCRILTENAIRAREFGHWQMALIDTEGRFATHDQYLSFGIMDFTKDIARYGRDASRARRLLTKFREGRLRSSPQLQLGDIA